MLELHTVHSVAKMDLPDGHQVPGSHQFHCDCEIMKGEGREAELLFGPTVAQASLQSEISAPGRPAAGGISGCQHRARGSWAADRGPTDRERRRARFPRDSRRAIGRRRRAAALEECNNPEESHRCGGEEGGNGNACQASDTQPGIVKLNRGLEE